VVVRVRDEGSAAEVEYRQLTAPAPNLRESHFSRGKHTGLSAFLFHDLRHTCATALLLANVHPKVVSERLGHSKIEVTLDTYSHLLPTMQTSAVAALEGLLLQSQ
jgi:integrase